MLKITEFEKICICQLLWSKSKQFSSTLETVKLEITNLDKSVLWLLEKQQKLGSYNRGKGGGVPGQNFQF